MTGGNIRFVALSSVSASVYKCDHQGAGKAELFTVIIIVIINTV